MIKKFSEHREEAITLLEARWGKSIVSKGVVYTYDMLDGFLYYEEGVKGIVTFVVEENLELISLDAFEPNRGIGKALIDAMKAYIESNHIEKMSLITTNDNTHAMRFYQKNGFKLTNIYFDTMIHSRMLKPEIPLRGLDGILIEHEIEFEYTPKIVYHGSHLDGLKLLTPRVGSHGENYVYGSYDPILAVLYLADWNEYILRIGHDHGKVYIVENYPGALKSVYYDKTGFIYEVAADKFKTREELWDGEVISIEPVQVINRQKVENIYDYIIHRDKEDLLDVYLYPNRPEFISDKDDDLIELAINNIHKFGKKEVEKFLYYHPELQEKLILAMKEHEKH